MSISMSCCSDGDSQCCAYCGFIDDEIYRLDVFTGPGLLPASVNAAAMLCDRYCALAYLVDCHIYTPHIVGVILAGEELPAPIQHIINSKDGHENHTDDSRS